MAQPTRLSATLIAIASAALLTLTGCAGNQAPGETDATGKSLTVAVVSPEKAGDGGPTDQMLAGLEQASKEHDLKTRHIEATDPSTYESTLQSLCQAKTEVIFVAFTQFTDAIKSVAPDCPDSKIIHLYADEYTPKLDNVQSVAYDTNGPAYLAGVLAAASTKTGKVGFVGGEALPQVNADYHAFKAGVTATDPQVAVTGVIIGSWTDQVKGQQVGQSLFGLGVDRALAYAGGASLGVVKAAQQNGSAVLSYDGIATDTISDVVSTTATQEFGTTIVNELNTIAKGDWKAGHTVATLADGGVVLNENPAFKTAGSKDAVADFEAAWPTVEQAKQAIISGDIKVPFDTSGF